MQIQKLKHRVFKGFHHCDSGSVWWLQCGTCGRLEYFSKWNSAINLARVFVRNGGCWSCHELNRKKHVQ